MAAMCTFVTISEKRGIVYSEHMLLVAAVIDATEHGNLDQSCCTVCILGTCKAPHVNIQAPSKEGRVMKAAKNRSMSEEVFIEL